MYSLDLRNAAIRMSLQCHSARWVANTLGVGKSTVCRWLVCSAFLRRIRSARKVTSTALALIHGVTIHNPFVTCSTLKNRLLADLQIDVSNSTIRRCLKSLAFSRKRTEQGFYIDAIVLQKRKIFASEISTCDIDSIVSIDETAIQFDMSPLAGYAPRGQRLRCVRKHKSLGKRFNVLMGTSTRGVVACKIVKGKVNGNVFADFIKDMQLHEHHKILLMDNVPFHKTKVVKEAAISIGASIMFVSPYSPDFNPIELCFARLKSVYRSQQPNLDPDERLKVAVSSISESLCASTFAHCLEATAAMLR